MTLKLEVDKTYRDCEGDDEKIVGMRAATAYRYESEDGICYTADGRFDVDQPGHDFDLIEEIEPDASTPKDLTPLPLCETLVKAARGMRLELLCRNPLNRRRPSSAL